MVKATFGTEEDEIAEESRRQRMEERIVTVVHEFVRSPHAMLVVKKDRNCLIFETTVKTKVEV